jgi:hypothetical protein
MRDEDGHGPWALERWVAGEGLVEHAGQGIEVGSPGHRLASDLLGSGIGDRAREMGRLRVAALLVRAPREPEIRQVTVLPAALVGDEDVHRLHVAVDEAARMGSVERVRHLADQRERPLRVEGPLAC